MNPFPKLLIVAGLILLAAGLLLHFLPSLPFLGRLPGDIRIERPGFRFYFPLTTSILISILLSAVLWIVSKWR